MEEEEEEDESSSSSFAIPPIVTGVEKPKEISEEDASVEESLSNYHFRIIIFYMMQIFLRIISLLTIHFYCRVLWKVFASNGRKKLVYKVKNQAKQVKTTLLKAKMMH